MTATETLDILQELYDGGLITYPRVADTVVTEDVAKEFPGILNRLKSKYADYLPGSIPSLLGNVRYVGPISDHHAVIPTGKLANIKSEMKLAVYDLIVKTFIAAHHPPGVDIVEKITTKVKDYVFLTSNTRTLTLGWRAIFHSNIITNSLLPISPPIKATAVLINEEETQPPSRYTEASILKAMERLGLGTPATRASIIENLKSKNYMLTLENSILPTEKGILLINFLENSKLVSPELTSSWEKHFNDIQSRKLSVEAFNIEVDDFVKAFVQEFKLSVGKNTKKQVVVLGDCPKCQEGKVLKLNRNNEHFYSCNRYQQGCRFFVSGKICEAIITESDVKQLLHKGRMPTKKFEFKTGRKKAQLILQKDGSTTFDFDNSIVSKIKNLLLRR